MANQILQQSGEQTEEERLSPEELLLFRLRKLYRQYGYRPYRMSKFEKYELYAGNKDFLVSDRIITFNDTNGELLALKPDVTLSIVKSAQFHVNRVERLYYQENVYRPSGSAHQFREIMQCGLECIGDLDCYGLFEVLFLADESLRAVSEESVLSFSHLGILKSLFRMLDAGDTQQEQLLSLIAARNLHELSALFAARGWEDRLFQDVKALLAVSCTLSHLPGELEALGLSWLGEGILQELKILAKLSSRTDDRARFDFSVINDIHYYNGLVFQGFVRGISEKFLSGGRYDSLLERMDRKGAAVGFAVYLGLLEQLRQPEETFEADVLLLYDEKTDPEALLDAEKALHAEGKSVSAQRSMAGRYAQVLDLREEACNA
ncbi:MAG: ATP phosphoribosyltransferase regulatory subunit [Oscillospiraceae bacterium]|nr:ATP phosphoribosyltransferase regulatory subunit [Oscillospiraceae bacterium]MBP5168781.1 ATP phosphoribosyltransferase regulatory subunit [Oscillospiraceae bacterium]